MNVWRCGWGVVVMAAVCLGVAGCATQTTVYIYTGADRLPGGATTAYSVQFGTDTEVVSYSLAASGNAAVNSTLTLPSNFGPTALAVDPANGTLYVGGDAYTLNAQTPEVLAYNSGATGSTPPARIIVGTATTSSFDEPTSLTVDSNGQLYVASTPNDNGTVSVYSSIANGTASPTRTITGTATGLYQPTQIVVDANLNLYVANIYSPSGGVIDQFGPTAAGDVAPMRAITNDTQSFTGVAVNPYGIIYAVAGDVDPNTGFVNNAAILEYDTTQHGAATPVASIAGTAVGLTSVGAIEMDSQGNFYVTQTTGSGTSASQQLLGFGPGASSNLAPDLIVQGNGGEAELTQFAIH